MRGRIYCWPARRAPSRSSRIFEILNRREYSPGADASSASSCRQSPSEAARAGVADLSGATREMAGWASGGDARPNAVAAIYCLIMCVNGGMCGAFGPSIECFQRATGLSQVRTQRPRGRLHVGTRSDTYLSPRDRPASPRPSPIAPHSRLPARVRARLATSFFRTVWLSSGARSHGHTSHLFSRMMTAPPLPARARAPCACCSHAYSLTWQ